MSHPDAMTPPWLFEFLGLSSPSTMVDVGCGDGSFTAFLADRLRPSPCVIGVDIDRDRLRTAWIRGGIRCVQADATGLPIRTYVADVVLCRRLLLNLNRPDRALSEMVRITKAGGTVAAIEPDFMTQEGQSTVPGELDFSRRILIASSTAVDLGFGPKAVSRFRESGLQAIEARTFPLETAASPRDLPNLHGERSARRWGDLVRAWHQEIIAKTGEQGFESLVREGEALDEVREEQVAQGRYSSASRVPVWVVRGRKPIA